jgi:pimeloyl-ACP methyl ester carboxylesterase
LVVGHSEGGIVAAHVAAADRQVTHVAVLAGGGPTQLFDLVELARQRSRPNEPPGAATARVDQFYKDWMKVFADPDNPDKLWLGHPYRRWSSFLRTSTLEGLLQSEARVYLAQGTTDKAVAVAGFDLLRAELAARGRDVTSERLEGYDHSFRKAGEPASSIDGMRDLLGRVVDWYLNEPKR